METWQVSFRLVYVLKNHHINLLQEKNVFIF